MEFLKRIEFCCSKIYWRQLRLKTNLKDGETITISFNKGFEGINTNEKVTSNKDKSLWEKYIDKKKNKRREKKEEEKIKRDNKKISKNRE